MLKIAVATIHPQFIEAYTAFGAVKAAIDKNLLALDVINLRDYAVDSRGTVDDAPYGGGDGMVLRCEPLANVVTSFAEKPLVILTSPAGVPFTQATAAGLSQETRSQLYICGRFAGVDQRFIDRYVDLEVSMGDFVVSGGELPVLTMIDATVRLLAGALGNEKSAADDSFAAGMAGLLEYPLYTRPPVFETAAVPAVLLSGDHEKIAKWRKEYSLALTRRRRPDLLPR